MASSRCMIGLEAERHLMVMEWICHLSMNSLGVKSTKSHSCSFWLLDATLYFLCFQQGVWTILVGSSTLILATFVYLIISDITLQGIGCFRRPRWFGGNESNRCKFTVPSKWFNMNYSKTDTIIQWDHDTMLSMCQWVCFTILIEMHGNFLPQVQTSGGLDVLYIAFWHT